MYLCKKKKILFLVFLFLCRILSAQEDDKLLMDFRNQKISDVIYSVADIFGQSVFVDETVTGTATFHFEDASFESALDRFADYCHLYVDKSDAIYKVSKVKMECKDSKISINTENVLVEPFLNLIARNTNSTIMYDSLPNASVTIRVQNVSIQDVLNLVLVKLPGFGLERISTGFYISKSASSNNSRRNVDVFTLSEVEGLYSISISKASFSNVIENLFKKADKEFSLMVKSQFTFETVIFRDKEFDILLRLLLEQANCDYKLIDNIYYIFEIQKKDVLKQLKETKLIKLKNITCDSLLNILPSELSSSAFMKVDKNTNTVILSGSKTEIAALDQFIEKIDIRGTQRIYKRFDFVNINVKDAVATIPKSFLVSDVVYVPNYNSFVSAVSEEEEKKLNDFISIIDNAEKIHIYKLKYIKSEELLKNLPPSVTKDNFIETQDPSLIFFNGSDSNFDLFKKQMEVIDKPKQQIKYHIFVVQRDKSDNFNWSLDASVNDVANVENNSYSYLLNFTAPYSIKFDLLSVFGLNLSAQMNLELDQQKSHVLADTTLNGISGETVTFSNTKTSRYQQVLPSSSTALVYSTSVKEISSGLIISVCGWASGDDMITTTINAEVSKESGNSSTTEGSVSLPATSEKKISTNIRTKSGEPVVIGGLYQQETDISEQKIPFLGSIPIIGYLFKKQVETVSDSEFIIYLVPYVETEYFEEESIVNNIKRLRTKYMSVSK